MAEDHFLSELTAYTKKQFFQVRVTWAEQVLCFLEHVLWSIFCLWVDFVGL